MSRSSPGRPGKSVMTVSRSHSMARPRTCHVSLSCERFAELSKTLVDTRVMSIFLVSLSHFGLIVEMRVLSLPGHRDICPLARRSWLGNGNGFSAAESVSPCRIEGYAFRPSVPASNIPSRGVCLGGARLGNRTLKRAETRICRMSHILHMPSGPERDKFNRLAIGCRELAA